MVHDPQFHFHSFALAHSISKHLALVRTKKVPNRKETSWIVRKHNRRDGMGRQGCLPICHRKPDLLRDDTVLGADVVVGVRRIAGKDRGRQKVRSDRAQCRDIERNRFARRLVDGHENAAPAVAAGSSSGQFSQANPPSENASRAVAAKSAFAPVFFMCRYLPCLFSRLQQGERRTFRETKADARRRRARHPAEVRPRR